MVVLKVRLQKSLHDEDKNSEIKKFCVGCKTTKTPLWRCGPSGPKTLCNACGIKYRKKKRVTAGLEKSGRKKKKSRTSTSTIGADCSNSDVADTVKTDGARNGMMSESLKMRLMLCGLDKSGRKKKKSHTRTSTNGATNCSNSNSNSNSSADTVKTRARNGLMSGESLKMGLVLQGNEMMFPKSPIVKKQRCQRRRKLGEEEQAAFSLMALSCGSVLA